jgi:hypothetical protein
MGLWAGVIPACTNLTNKFFDSCLATSMRFLAGPAVVQELLTCHDA